MYLSTTVKRLLLWSGQSLARNKLLSVTTVIAIALILFFISILDGVNFLSHESIREISDKIDLTLEINDGVKIDDPVVVNLRTAIEGLGMTVSTVSKEQAMENFKQITAPDLVGFLDAYGINPLPASLLVKAGTLEQYKGLEEIIGKPGFKEIVNLDQNENGFLQQKERIEKIQRITDGTNRAVLAVRTIFFIIAVIIIINTLQIVIAHHHEEITIMEVVGAPHLIIMGPFVLEGIAYAILGVLVGTAMFFATLSIVQAKILAYLPQTALHPFLNLLVQHNSARFLSILVWNALSFSIIGIIASLIALSYQMNLIPSKWIQAWEALVAARFKRAPAPTSMV